ncbi:aminoacyl--tRNA ligase-related protein [Streptomyces bobili]|uniref:aminoacyl--tRNA ligase-related protein n=1 Tax=Streptomyces bobili TaxID=67280 RepID=UPI0033B60DC4
MRYHHKRAVTAASAEELQKALTFYYGSDTVQVRQEAEGLSVEVGVRLTESELADVVRHFLRGHRDVPVQVIAEHGPVASTALPLPPGDDRIPIAGGTYLQGPEWGAALERTRQLVYERVAAEFDAPHLTGSAQISREVLLRAGYFRKFPNLVNVVSRIRPDYWDGVTVSRLRPGQNETLASFYEPSDLVLNPVTCYHVYSNALELHRRHRTELFAIEGPIFRHEAHNHSATRLAEFRMFELVRLGRRDEVSAEFERLLDSFSRFFISLGLPHRVVSASDAFFGDDPSLSRDAQLLNGSKFEVRVPLADGELSVASVNAHGEVFADAFGLRDAMGVETTCCAGIGLDRLTYALLAHDLLSAEAATPGARPSTSDTRSEM